MAIIEYLPGALAAIGMALRIFVFFTSEYRPDRKSQA